MKKAYLAGFAMAAIVAGVFGVMRSNATSATKLTPLQMQNIEALTRGEGGDEIPCHSQATRSVNDAYVDCSSCKRYTGWKAKGTQAYCTN